MTIKIPKPPEGFVPFKWKRKTITNDLGLTHTCNVCPSCGEFGFAWGPQGFKDKFLMALHRLNRKKDLELMKREQLDHPSRYCLGECLSCGCKLWHDFNCIKCGKDCSLDKIGCSWHYYYNQQTSKVNKQTSLLGAL